MESVKRMFFEFLGLAVLLSVASHHHVRGDAASDLQRAFDQMSRSEQRAFGRLGTNFLETLKNVANCIQRETAPIDLCSFNTSFDPFFYIQKCAQGTVLQKFIQTFVRSIPPLKLPFGVPRTVSKDRCDCDRVPQLRCSSILPPSILGKDPFLAGMMDDHHSWTKNDLGMY